MPETWLIRHAQSTSNAGLPSETPALTSLSDLGREQAKLLANSIDLRPDLIVTSPYIRTLLTAQPLLDRLPGCAHEEWPVQEFTYISPDAYHGSTPAERRPAVQAYWEALDPETPTGRGAESFVSFLDRVNAFIERARAQDGITFVFSHGQFMRGCLWSLFLNQSNGAMDMTESMFRFRNWRSAFRMGNTAIVKIRWEKEGPFFTGMSLEHLPAEVASY